MGGCVNTKGRLFFFKPSRKNASNDWQKFASSKQYEYRRGWPGMRRSYLAKIVVHGGIERYFEQRRDLIRHDWAYL